MSLSYSDEAQVPLKEGPAVQIRREYKGLAGRLLWWINVLFATYVVLNFSGILQMLGVFISVWNNLPLEAVTVWIFCMLVVLLYEFLKITFFTDPSKKKKKVVKKSR